MRLCSVSEDAAPVPLFVHTSELPHPVERVAEWHLRPGALERLMPPWAHAHVVQAAPSITNGATTLVEFRTWPFRARWLSRFTEVHPGRSFTDEQLSGPMARWRHQHLFVADGHRKSVLEDHIEYQLPWGRVGRVLAGRWVRTQLRRAFEYRHRHLAMDLGRHAEHPTAEPLRVAVSGSSGLIGGALRAFLTSGGHQVRPIVRGKASFERSEIGWEPASGRFDAAHLEGLDAVVHLAGAGIAEKAWSPERKEIIRASRVEGTKQLCQALAALSSPPKVLVAASAIGYYGDRGERQLDEHNQRGHGFLADVCEAWERATQPAEMAGIRVVHLRFGIVLSGRGGVLPLMAIPFRAGLGGQVGGGRQGMSWISIDDAVAAILFSIVTPSLYGAVNATAPAPRSNRDFSRTLARVLRRPSFMRVPAVAVRAFMRERGTSLLLHGNYVEPVRLLEHGFRFHFAELEPALRFELGRFLT